jgi:hypothetical protein
MKCEKCSEDHDGSYGSGRFCGRGCANSRTHTVIDSICVKCGDDVQIPNTFPKKWDVICDGCKPKIKKRVKVVYPLCLNCGSVTSRSDSKYCCKECARISIIKNARDKRFKKVEDSQGVGCDIRWIKEYLLDKYGHKCWICGLKEWMGEPIPVIIDHINGRAHYNRLDNLQIVCGNCDMQLPTYKSKNKNSDRTKR